MNDLTLYTNKSLSFYEYLESIKNDIKEKKPLSDYSELNMKRMERVSKKFHLSENQKKELETISPNFKVLIITEGWCGDAAQTLPILESIFKEIGIETNYILRDNHIKIMQNYLTNGAQSIPILIVTDIENKELFFWGPRPKQGKELLLKHKQNPKEFSKEKFYIKLQQFYNKDKGISTYTEVVNLLTKNLK